MALQAAEGLKNVQSRQMGRREFLSLGGKVAIGVAMSPIFLNLFREIGKADDTSVEFVDNPAYIAGNYGYDDISNDSRFWRKSINPNTQQWDGGWVFDSTLGDGVTFQGDGKPHGIVVAGKDGHGAEMIGWEKIPVPGGDFSGIIVAHRNVGISEAIQATIYKHNNADMGWANVVDYVRNNRTAGQIWLPLNIAPTITVEGDIPLYAVSQQDAARILGVPGTWGADPSHWTAIDGGPQGDRVVKLNANPDGSNTGILLRSPEGNFWGSYGSSWPVVDGALAKEGIPASRFAAHPDVQQMFGTEMSVRFTSNPGSLWKETYISIGSTAKGLNVMPIIRIR